MSPIPRHNSAPPPLFFADLPTQAVVRRCTSAARLLSFAQLLPLFPIWLSLPSDLYSVVTVGELEGSTLRLSSSLIAAAIRRNRDSQSSLLISQRCLPHTVVVTACGQLRRCSVFIAGSPRSLLFPSVRSQPCRCHGAVDVVASRVRRTAVLVPSPLTRDKSWMSIKIQPVSATTAAAAVRDSSSRRAVPSLFRSASHRRCHSSIYLSSSPLHSHVSDWVLGLGVYI